MPTRSPSRLNKLHLGFSRPVDILIDQGESIGRLTRPYQSTFSLLGFTNFARLFWLVLAASQALAWSSFGQQFSADQAAPPQHRKIAFNGRPLPDGKPQTAPESDAANEENFVDAFTLGLHHDTTDVYVPISGTDLVLQVRRSTASEIWDPREGFLPTEMPDRPFGSGWSSNLAANIHFVHQADPSHQEADYAYVTDDNGDSYRFLIIKKPGNTADTSEYYVALPASRNQQDAYVNTLTDDGGGNWILQRKYSTRLFFEKAGADRLLDHDRVYPARSVPAQIHTFARLTRVTDRTGTSLNYSYSGSDSLVPSRIAVSDRPQALEIGVGFDGRVYNVTDPRGNTWNYGYTNQPVPTDYLTLVNGLPPYSSGSGSQSVVACMTLTNVTPPAGAIIGPQLPLFYDYDLATINDTVPVSLPRPHLYCDVKSIRNARGKTYAIIYVPDRSNEVAFGNIGEFYPAPGSPRIVSRIDLPDSLGQTRFECHSFTSVVPDYTSQSLAFVGHKANAVTDAAGNGRVYEFTDPSMNILASFTPYIPLIDKLNPFGVPHIVLYQREVVTSYDGPPVVSGGNSVADISVGAGIGRESFTFDPLAGLAPASVTDWSGNTTSFEYGDSWDLTANYSFLTGVNYAFGRYADPTLQTNAKGKTKQFAYFAVSPAAFDPRGRRMTRMTDEEGRLTVYSLDSYGNRTSEKIYSPSGTLVKWTDFEYNHPVFHGFMTKRIVRSIN